VHACIDTWFYLDNVEILRISQFQKVCQYVPCFHNIYLKTINYVRVGGGICRLAIKEIFPNPTVKQVIFAIEFPNLFYTENKIGDLQVKIMNEFPKSKLVFRRPLLFSDVGTEEKRKDIDERYGKKIWQFISDKKFQLSITSNSLDILSEYHKTYNLDGADKFRDTIDFALKNFFAVMAIPLVNRIGLRYIDECPLPTKNNETFSSYYNSVFPIERFNIADSEETFFRTVTKRGEFNLIYMESLQKRNDKYVLILDFDGFAKNIKSEDCLTVTDKLHDIILKEFESTIKEPVYAFMRQRSDS